MARLIIACIRLYQRILSPLPMFRQCCRFEPSCSRYAIEAIQTHGVLIGLGYTCWRLLRCQPFCKGGHDPVPPRPSGPPHTLRKFIP